MFDDNSVTWNLAVMLRTMDITLSVDHMVKLADEGYDVEYLDEYVVESLIAQQDELEDELAAQVNMLASDEFTVQNRIETIESLEADYDNFTDRLVELTS